MKVTKHPTTFHLPEWAAPYPIVGALAEEAVRDWSAKEYAKASKDGRPLADVKWRVASTFVSAYGDLDRPHWCWRHFRKCRVVGLGWTIAKGEPAGE